MVSQEQGRPPVGRLCLQITVGTGEEEEVSRRSTSDNELTFHPLRSPYIPDGGGGMGGLERTLGGVRVSPLTSIKEDREGKWVCGLCASIQEG